MLLRTFLSLVTLFSAACTEAVVGGIGVSSILFSKHEYAVFSSRKVHEVKNKIDGVLYKYNNSKRSIKLVQQGSAVYAIGLVNNKMAKNDVISILNSEFKRYYIDEISIDAKGRSYVTDLYLKTKIRKKLLFARYVKSQNYTIVVYNQKAFVVGQASNSAEKDIVVNILAKIEYIDDVIAYII